MTSPTKIEDDLIRQLKRIGVPYRNGIQAVRDACRSDNWEVALGRLRSAMQLVQQYSPDVTAAISAWQDLDVTPRSDVQVALDTYKRLLEEFMRLLNNLEQSMLAEQQELAPAVDQFVQSQRMRESYGRAAAASSE